MRRKPDSRRLIVFQKDDYTGVCRLRIFWFWWIWPTRSPRRIEPLVGHHNLGAELAYMARHPEIWPVKKARRARRTK
jgi:hypothetical protein